MGSRSRDPALAWNRARVSWYRELGGFLGHGTMETLHGLHLLLVLLLLLPIPHHAHLPRYLRLDPPHIPHLALALLLPWGRVWCKKKFIMRKPLHHHQREESETGEEDEQSEVGEGNDAQGRDEGRRRRRRRPRCRIAMPAIPPSHDARQGAVRARRAPIRGRPYHHLTYRRARTRASSTYHPRHNMW